MSVLQLEQLLVAHAEYARANEPGTLHYDVQRGANRETGAETIIVWERYADKAAETAHFNNDAFSKLIQTLGAEALTTGAPAVYVTASAGGIANYKA